MSCKRKFDSDDELAAPASAKQLKLVPFPSYDADNDVNMSDDSSDDSYTSRTRMSHLSTASTASSTFSTTSNPSSPAVFTDPNGMPTGASEQPSPFGCGVLGSSFQHQRDGCTRLPKLRMACAAGPGRSRTMWSHCEECGAIAMVELD